ncbi:MAG: TonB-dependent receptor [Cytophagales bacterium]|nr:TonB-dependent receptor [Cytophagales bacterium]
MKKQFIYLLINLVSFITFAQNKGTLEGYVTSSENEKIGFASVWVEDLQQGVISDENGYFIIEDIEKGIYTLKIGATGYRIHSQKVEIKENEITTANTKLEEDVLMIDAVVITATRNLIKKQEAPAIVNVVTSQTFENTQSVSLAEGIIYQPGIRLENNCQNCGFSSVRMNGLDGPYSQILIDSRAVFSALNGVYGLDQIPASMIDRVEVVKGGGSALFGANAIAGTINIITKDPTESTYQINTNHALINGETTDNAISFNASVVDDSSKTGLSFFGIFRDRNPYDHNGDGFSEITLMENNSIGLKGFYKITPRKRLELEFHTIKEFRRGGNLFDQPAHLTDVTEQLDHQTVGGQLGYEYSSKNERNHLNTYLSFQTTKRLSYYGGGGNIDLSTAQNLEDSLALYQEQELAAKYYGNTDDLSLVGGTQYTLDLDTILQGKATLTSGIEWQYNGVIDRLSGYNRTIDQEVNNIGAYVQLELRPLKRTTLLLGLRSDNTIIDGKYDFGVGETQNTDINVNALNPRINLKYDLSDHLALRLSYATGFRAPQAFDEDLHIATVGGEAQFIRLAEDLKKETSNSYNASLVYTKDWNKWQSIFTLDGFYTVLKNQFVNELLPSSDVEYFSLVEKRNGGGATVRGFNLEAMLAPSKKLQIQAAITLQEAIYNEDETIWESENGDTIVSTNQILRSPNLYGYMTFTWNPNDHFTTTLSSVYTGGMIAPHIVNVDNEFTVLENTRDFVEFNLKVGYTFKLKSKHKIQVNAGIQNILSAYQDDFDLGTDRDAAYIYGPTRPRTFFFGVKIGNGF